MGQKDLVMREGFQVLKDQFIPPADVSQLRLDIKRKVTICNLFLNYNLSVKDIMEILDESYKHTVNALIEQGILEERRAMNREAQKPEKYVSLLSARLKDSGWPGRK